jgi:uncharacterized membrane protein
VLRAKVGVFVDLWVKNRQLATQADLVRQREEQWRALSAAVDRAIDRLRTDEVDTAAVADDLESARWSGTDR